MRGSNDFLKQFMEMRKQIAPNPSAAAAVAAQAPLAKRAKTGGPIREVMEGSISYIIEHKPPKKYVGEYFQKMCDELTGEKMR